ncbi:type II toxin-antitoxin system RelE/ParE family toxin [Herbaspirillum sp. AP02]|nr:MULTISPECIES: type II toxin-antitoxin system RelE/ParE family toxin [Herbaspirillum]MBG7618892.1 type II toxin-antitoxin system RelE/ParE family toxin [Herbaspirillum sp. AP02]MCI1013419.1 type II toxin-antitoxin system RelE/ParE family toxin [Herbaspirillum sp. C7C2]NZD67306.1 type II toxin-antitoxin system RelE/ParE family toxin [Herbaspirillum sp. AP21]ONN68168.1 excinuclease ABC subunit A [Herbaspirillum sp. VT-16-41]
MILSFSCADTESLFHSLPVKRFRNIERVARRKLLMIHAASALSVLQVPPGNHLESLRGNRKGQYSIRISGQWRICFRWTAEGVHDVEIVDYH